MFKLQVVEVIDEYGKQLQVVEVIDEYGKQARLMSLLNEIMNQVSFTRRFFSPVQVSCPLFKPFSRSLLRREIKGRREMAVLQPVQVTVTHSRAVLDADYISSLSETFSVGVEMKNDMLEKLIIDMKHYK